ncbi:Retrovirus-related Pol polyprotein from transposon opus [Vitis vinifera]|uniref:Retrovirus-related Pol polyprotein from transposon opus n=1 Tax=Vitis vinifera TaxID=29760 RepID=A0A438DZD3_VITVI|nr:Retrovirus-related Pol polyprotein from transposon opus [Vitis vinifera]
MFNTQSQGFLTLIQVQEKGKFPSQPHQNPKGIHEVEAQEGKSSKDCLLEVLRRSKKVIRWQISDLKWISPLVCTHHIYMEDEAKPVRQPQRKLNPHMQEIEIEVETRRRPLSHAHLEPMHTGECLSVYAMHPQLSKDAFVLNRCIEKDLVLNWENVISWYTKGLSLGTSSPRKGSQLAMPFEIMCDASDFAIGAILRQKEDGKPYVIYYASKTLNEAQRNYTTTEKELLVVVFALDKFRAYLVGSFNHGFHLSLYFEIKDKKRVENMVADHLSRLAIAQFPWNAINDDFQMSLSCWWKLSLGCSHCELPSHRRSSK